MPRRRDKIIRRIRTVRSTFHIKTQSMPQERKLRRMKTFANLSYYSYRMDSLAGKSLETLARLGGHSFLAYPGDFAPTALKLPVCFVATATYLRCRGMHLLNLRGESSAYQGALQVHLYETCSLIRVIWVLPPRYMVISPARCYLPRESRTRFRLR